MVEINLKDLGKVSSGVPVKTYKAKLEKMFMSDRAKYDVCCFFGGGGGGVIW